MTDRIEELRAAYDDACNARDAAAIACSKATAARDASLEVALDAALDAWRKALAALRTLEAAEKEVQVSDRIEELRAANDAAWDDFNAAADASSKARSAADDARVAAGDAWRKARAALRTLEAAEEKELKEEKELMKND